MKTITVNLTVEDVVKLKLAQETAGAINCFCEALAEVGTEQYDAHKHLALMGDSIYMALNKIIAKAEGREVDDDYDDDVF